MFQKLAATVYQSFVGMKVLGKYGQSSC